MEDCGLPPPLYLWQELTVVRLLQKMLLCLDRSPLCVHLKSNSFKIILKNNSLLKSYAPRFSVSFGLGRSRMSLTEKEEVLGILIERSLNKNDAHHDHVYYDDDCESDHPHVHGEKLGKQNLQYVFCAGFI